MVGETSGLGGPCSGACGGSWCDPGRGWSGLGGCASEPVTAGTAGRKGNRNLYMSDWAGPIGCWSSTLTVKVFVPGTSGGGGRWSPTLTVKVGFVPGTSGGGGCWPSTLTVKVGFVPGTSGGGGCFFLGFDLPSLTRPARPDLQRMIKFEHYRCNRIEGRTWKQGAGARQTVPPQQRDIK